MPTTAQLTFLCSAQYFMASHKCRSFILRPANPSHEEEGIRCPRPLTKTSANTAKEFADSGLRAFSVKGAQAIAVEARYTKKSHGDRQRRFPSFCRQVLRGRWRSRPTLRQKQAYESFVAEATKFGDLYSDLAKEA